MQRIRNTILWKLDIRVAATAVALVAMLLVGTYVYASSTSNFQQTINAGTLAIDIVDGTTYASIASPSVVMGARTFSFACQTSTGTFGSASQSIYVSNPDAADNGWTASLAGSATTAVWDSVGTDYDFNDPTTSGCADGADTDTLAGQMTVNPAAGTLTVGQCNTCVTSNITLGSSTGYNEGTTNSVTVLTAAALSNDIGDWKLTGVPISQTVPEEQPPASDYDVSMVLSVVAS
ncbi:MAG: hypothetical protein HYZ09_01210 [Candidatus Kerfeldbacteria bacterium]|nr:hypothetical protein [Candidatus Kerfeldbacteria bacterium]